VLEESHCWLEVPVGTRGFIDPEVMNDLGEKPEDVRLGTQLWARDWATYGRPDD